MKSDSVDPIKYLEAFIRDAEFYDNIKTEGGMFLPSKASFFILEGLEHALEKKYKDEQERENSLRIKNALIMGMYEPIIRELEKKEKKGEMTRFEIMEALRKEGMELAKEFLENE